MSKQVKPCIVTSCELPKKAGKHKCVWHWLLGQPIDEQVRYAEARLARMERAEGFVRRSRVPDKEWPEGRRFCSGCQFMVPLFYVRGSRCVACNSRANHAGMVERQYGIDGETYRRLFEWQGGKCFICRRVARSKRLAVDHDHETGAVRGLLCADNERGCNHAILGNVRDLEMARRIPAYLERPPLERMLAGEPAVTESIRESRIEQDWPPPGF